MHRTSSLPALKPLLAALLVAFVPLAAHAATPGVPDTGSILRQVEPAKPQQPAPAATGLSIDRGAAASLPASAPFLVTQLQLSGNTLFDTAVLQALVADAVGKQQTLTQLGELAARITAYYQERGYPLARAIIPAQTISGGVVRIDVIEARYGEVQLNNTSAVDTMKLKSTLLSLQSGQVIAQAEMDRALLLLSDIPGVIVGATLKPGQAVGTSDLQINTTPAAPVWGNVTADNYGNRYTGRARIGGTVNVNNPLHLGDVLSVSALTSGSDLNYGRLAYDVLVNGAGTHVGASYSALRYALGAPLTALNAHGTAQVASVWAKHPLLRSRNANLSAQIQYDQLRLRDQVDATALRTYRNLANWTVSLNGDARDAWLGGGINTASLGWTTGRVSFDDAAAEAADATTARTRGTFSKFTANLSRLQFLGAQTSMVLTLGGQWANTNLDSAEKMSVGGPYSVRAYDVGVVSGDSGYRSTLELRHNLGQVWQGQWQAIAFVDHARVTVNKNTWVAGTNSATLSGAGVGLNWSGPDQWSVRTSVATPIGATPTLVGTTKSARAWLEVGKRF